MPSWTVINVPIALCIWQDDRIWSTTNLLFLSHSLSLTHTHTHYLSIYLSVQLSTKTTTNERKRKLHFPNILIHHQLHWPNHSSPVPIMDISDRRSLSKNKQTTVCLPPSGWRTLQAHAYLSRCHKLTGDVFLHVIMQHISLQWETGFQSPPAASTS